MEITPLIPEGKQVINGYGGGEFQVNGQPFKHSIIVLPDMTVQWNIADISDINHENIQAILDHAEDIEVLLIGSGLQQQQIPVEVVKTLKEQSIVVDVMDTGAACRTYNVLLSEERRIAAALIAV